MRHLPPQIPSGRKYRIRPDVARALMAVKGMSLTALAKALPIDRKRVSAWMKGEPAYLQSIVRLAEVLETRTQELIEGVQPVTSTITASFTVQNAEEMRLLANLLAEAQLKLEAFRERKVRVYYLRSTNHEGTPIWAYAVVSSLLHEQFMAALQENQVPDYAVIANMGEGEPSEEEKNTMKAYYGFDHDAYMNTPTD